MRHFLFFWILILFAFFAGCSSKKQVRQQVPAVPEAKPTQSAANMPEKEAPGRPLSRPDSSTPSSSPSRSSEGVAIYSELGIASWYGPPYHNRRSSNGEIYDMHALTAAHRTLPFNSIVRVTNIKTGSSAIVRITDRGPFVGDRMIDLSLAAAKAVDVWAPGTAWVRIEVLGTPAPIESGGRWAVQIGAFQSPAAAAEMKSRLMRRYHTAKVLQFTGPTGEWVRVRVPEDDKERAQEIARSTDTPEGGIFLVRLD